MRSAGAEAEETHVSEIITACSGVRDASARYYHARRSGSGVGADERSGRNDDDHRGRHDRNHSHETSIADDGALPIRCGAFLFILAAGHDNVAWLPLDAADLSDQFALGDHADLGRHNDPSDDEPHCDVCANVSDRRCPNRRDGNGNELSTLDEDPM